MATKTSKKAPAKVVQKKVTAPKPVAVKKSTVKFISFSFGATIPTQSFGNVLPRIEVQAASYEDARDFAIPKIEELYRHFAEVKPTFLGKITETVKVVTPEPIQANGGSQAQTVAAPQATAQSSPEPVAAPKPKSDAVLKAEKAISLAMSEDAATAIQDQIEKSVKIAPEDKPALLNLCLHKRNEFKKL